MHGSVEESTVKLTSYEQTGENSKITLKDPPSPEVAGNLEKSRQTQEGLYGKESSDEETDPTYTSINRQKDGDGAPPVPPKNPALLDRNSLNLNTQVPPSPFPPQPKDEVCVDAPQNSTLSRSLSQDTVFDNPENLDLDKTSTRLSGELSDKLSNTSSTTLPSYKSKDGSEKSLLSESEFGINSDATSENKKTNRIWPRAKYAIQQKGFIIFSAAAIMFSASAALVYLQDKAKFAALFANGSLYVTIPVIALAALLAISPILFAIKQFRNTAEHKTQEKNADGILAEVLEHQPKDKAIKSVRLEYSNGTHSNFVFNAWEAKNNFINIDEKVVSRTNKIESVINNRPLFTALLTGVVAANIALPLLLYAEGGVNNVQKFYQNPLTNDIGLSLLIGSGILALSIICLGVHYYRKTNCTNLIYSQEKIDTESVNKKFIEEIKQERTEVLGENHSKDAKRSSLTLEQVVVQSHNCKDAVYSVG